jgi:hypothetical protein
MNTRTRIKAKGEVRRGQMKHQMIKTSLKTMTQTILTVIMIKKSRPISKENHKESKKPRKYLKKSTKYLI